jgi:Kef-type K+ transport system membrane component KefB
VSHAASETASASTRAVQALALVVAFAFAFVASRWAPEVGGVSAAIAAIGFLLLAGTLLSELLEIVGLPHLSAYLIVGIVAGPHVMHLVSHETVEQLSPVNTLALALIALAGGAELRISTLKSVARSVSVALFLQCVVGLILMMGVFYVLARFSSFGNDFGNSALFGISLLWGVVAVTRSPSACLGILTQTRAKGPVANFSLAFILSSDIVIVTLMACALMLARPLITPGGSISLADFNVLAHELLGSISVGTALGLLLAVYLRLVGKNLLLVLLALGFGMTEFMRYVHIDPLLSFMTAGFVVQNLTNQGDKLLHTAENVSSIVFVVFFATAGAHLDLPLLAQLWPLALALCVSRAGVTYGLARLSSVWAKDSPPLRKWAWSGLLSQAGFALGLNVIIVRTFPEVGASFGSLVVACVAINEMVGPVLFKFALDRAGETDDSGGPSRPSLTGGTLPTDSHV